MDTKEFLDKDWVSNQWVKDFDLEIYLRKSTRFIDYNKIRTIDLANITSENPGEGNLKRYLPYLEKSVIERNFRYLELGLDNAVKYGYHAIYVENILNTRLTGFYMRNDYSIVNETSIGDNTMVSMIKYLVNV